MCAARLPGLLLAFFLRPSVSLRDAPENVVCGYLFFGGVCAQGLTPVKSNLF